MVLLDCDVKLVQCKVKSQNQLESWGNTTVASCWKRAERATTIRWKKSSITTNRRNQLSTGNWISLVQWQASEHATENRWAQQFSVLRVKKKIFSFVLEKRFSFTIEANQLNKSFQLTTRLRSEHPRQLGLQCASSCIAERTHVMSFLILLLAFPPFISLVHNFSPLRNAYETWDSRFQLNWFKIFF